MACLLGHSPSAQAAKRLVVMSFSGVKGVEAGNQIAAALEGRFQLISPSRFIATARRQGLEVRTDEGRVAAAAALRVAAVVDGSVRRSRGRWILHLRIYNGQDGKILASATFPMRSARVDSVTEARVKRRILQATRQARAPARGGGTARLERPRRRQAKPAPAERPRLPRAADEPSRSQPLTPSPAARRPASPAAVPALANPRPRPRPKPPTAEDDSLGFEVYGSRPQEPAGSGELGFTVSSSKKTHQQSSDEVEPAARPAPPLGELLLGILIFDRAFTFRQAIDPIVPPNFKSGLIPAALLEGELYPLAWLRSALWSNLGLRARFSLVPLLETQMLGIPQPMATTLYDLELGLRYRWQLLGRVNSPVLTFGADFGRSVLSIAWPAGLGPLPPIAYHFFSLSAELRWLFFQRGQFSLAAGGGGSYQFYLSEGDLERVDSLGFGQSDTHGAEGRLGLDIGYRGFFARLWGQGRFVFLDFDNRCYTSGQGCKVARGAFDMAIGGGLGLGYIFR